MTEAFSSFRSQIEIGMKNWSLAASKLSVDMKAALEVIFENSIKMPSPGGLIKQSPGHFASNPKWSGREWVKKEFVDGGTHMNWLPRDPPKRSDPINRKREDEENRKLRAGAERMLAALVQWSPESMSEGQMRSHAGLKKSGTFEQAFCHTVAISLFPLSTSFSVRQIP